MAEDRPNPPALRASDADRDRTLDVLRAAVGDGRLFPAEFDERADAALTARTLDELATLTADLGTAPAPAPVTPAVPTAGTQPAVPQVERSVIRESWSPVRREGRWKLPHRLVVNTRWSPVTLDLTKAERGGPELIVELRARGGVVELILTPDTTVDVNDLSAKYSGVDIGTNPDEDTPERLHVRIVGRIKHGGVAVRWQGAPRVSGD